MAHVWGQLQDRIKPSFNPLSYESGVLFLVTLIPRYALTVRRLHDAGRSPRWALLPFKSTILSIWLIVGLGSASLMASVSSTGEAAVNTAAAVAVETGEEPTLKPAVPEIPETVKEAAFRFAMLSALNTEGGWDIAFNVAAATKGMDWFAVLQALPRPDLTGALRNISTLSKSDAGAAAGATAMLGMIVLGPFILMTIFM